MSAELLDYCLGQLRSSPRALNINQPLTTPARNQFIKVWSATRFEEQQQSILKLGPDHPEYGRSFLWPYELMWTEQATGVWMLRIQYNLRTSASPRELILLASVSELPIPFTDGSDTSYSNHLFRAAKSRMLGGEGRRAAKAIAPSLRPAVISVQYLCQPDGVFVSAVNFENVVSIEI